MFSRRFDTEPQPQPPARRALSPGTARLLWTALPFLLFFMPLASQSPIVYETHLDDGPRVLLAPRPAAGALHAAVFFDGGHTPPNAPAELDSPSAGGRDGNAGAFNPDGFWVRQFPDGLAYGRDMGAEELELWLARALGGHPPDTPPGRGRNWGPVRRSAPTGGPTGPLAELYAFVFNDASQEQAGSHAPTAPTDPTDPIAPTAHPQIPAPAGSGGAMVVLVGDFDEAQAMGAIARAALDLPRTWRGDAAQTQTELVQSSRSDSGPGGGTAHPTEAPGQGGGTLAAAPGAASEPSPPIHLSPSATGVALADGERTKTIPTATAPEALVAWRIPQPTPGRRLELELLAEILAGGEGSPLRRLLVDELGCSTRVTAFSHYPSRGRDGIFVIRADAAQGRLPQEVGGAIRSGVQRVFEGGLSDSAVNRAFHRLATKRAAGMADAAGLARALIGAQRLAGDWAAALVLAPPEVPLAPQDFVATLNATFAPDSAFSLLSERDPTEHPSGPEETRLVSILERLLAKRPHAHAHKKNLLRETMRLFALLPPEQRLRAMSALAAEAER